MVGDPARQRENIERKFVAKGLRRVEQHHVERQVAGGALQRGDVVDLQLVELDAGAARRRFLARHVAGDDFCARVTQRRGGLVELGPDFKHTLARIHQRGRSLPYSPLVAKQFVGRNGTEA